MDISNIIIIVILILVVIWGLNNLFFKTNIIYDLMCDASTSMDTGELEDGLFGSNKNIIKAKDIPENNSSNFMLSVWFYIDNWGNNISNEKNILFMATSHNAITVDTLQDNLSGISTKVTKEVELDKYKNINVCLDKYENNLFIDVETYIDNSSRSTTSISGEVNFIRYKLDNIPVQKWNNLTLSIDTRTLDVYLDGKLRNSFILHGLYKNYYQNQKKKNIYLGNMHIPSTTNGTENTGFEGYITRVRYESHSINPQQAYNIYKDGINASLANSMFNKYRLKVSFLEYNKEKGTFTI
jgi:hypothetical protein